MNKHEPLGSAARVKQWAAWPCVAEDADAMRPGMRHVEDYFARRSPFGSKKKTEFPEAISIASSRCQQRNSTACLVSEDADLRECCFENGPLFHSKSNAEIISQATVSQEVHDALKKGS